MRYLLVLRRLAALALMGLALAVPTVAAEAQQLLTRADALDRGAVFETYFERPASCITRIMDAPGSSVVIELDCRNRPLGTTVLFDLFKGILLDPAWAISSFSTSTGDIVTRPSGVSPRISVRLRTEPGTRRTATVNLVVARPPASLPEPLPNCRGALTQRPRDFVCHSDADCTPRIANGPVEICSVPCGNRCVPK